jgi:HSP20 family protein
MLEVMLTRPQGIFDQLDAVHRMLARSLGTESPGTIRSVAQGAFPELNVGRTPTSLEVFAFAPGLDAQSIDVVVERNLLKISGSRQSGIPRGGEGVQLYANERPEGSFVRAVTLPDDADTGRVEARYRDGVLRVSVALADAPQPQRIAVQ